MEKITAITECTFKRHEGDWDSFDGFKVITNDQEIILGISNSQSCCENWGYFMTNDDTSDFIGAEVIGVKLTDECLNPVKFKDELDIYEGGVMFVDIVTDRGPLQFVAYNSHNGYYGHTAVVISKQLKEETCL